jgi:hypothetical protein
MASTFTAPDAQAPNATHHSNRWQSQAACRDADPELFFPTGETAPAIVQTQKAKTICDRCPVLETCLQWAMDNGLEDGVWGGLSESERRNLRRRTAKAAAKERQIEEAEQAPACGTTKAYYQHLFAGESIDPACQAASDAYEQQAAEQEALRSAKCGTRAGYQKHLRDHTEICDPCRQANTDADRRLRNTGTTVQQAAA